MIRLQDIPRSYALCLATEAVCPRAATCLHARAMRVVAESDDNDDWYQATVLNPRYALRAPARCPHYRSDTPVQMARGMTHLFDEVPYAKGPSIRRQVMRCFSSERYFYYCRKGLRPITPAEQQAVARVFSRAGLSVKPVFDQYEEGFDW